MTSKCLSKLLVAGEIPGRASRSNPGRLGKSPTPWIFDLISTEERAIMTRTSKNKVQSDEWVTAIINDFYQQDLLKVVTEVQKDPSDLLFFCRGINESFFNFEERFATQLAKFNVHNSPFPDPISGLIMPSNAAVDSSQPTAILTAAALTLENSLFSKFCTAYFLDKVA